VVAAAEAHDIAAGCAGACAGLFDCVAPEAASPSGRSIVLFSLQLCSNQFQFLDTFIFSFPWNLFFPHS
jgi:hypothetical protein